MSRMVGPNTSTTSYRETAPDWQTRALCRDADDPDLWHPVANPDSPKYARDCAEAIDACLDCPVMLACRDRVMELERGMSLSSRHGIWAAMTPVERDAADDTPRYVQRSTRPEWIEACVTRPGTGRAVARHEEIGTPLCPPCQEYANRAAARDNRNAAVEPLMDEGWGPTVIAHKTGLPYMEVKGAMKVIRERRAKRVAA